MAFHIAARVLISSVFVGLGLERLLGAAGIVGAGREPASAGALAFAVFELIAGLLLVFGWHLRWTALVMAVFLLVDAFLAHPFWRHMGAEQHGQLLHFLKNISMIGGLLLLSSLGSMREPGVVPRVGGSG